MSDANTPAYDESPYMVKLRASLDLVLPLLQIKGDSNSLSAGTVIRFSEKLADGSTTGNRELNRLLVSLVSALARTPEIVKLQAFLQDAYLLLGMEPNAFSLDEQVVRQEAKRIAALETGDPKLEETQTLIRASLGRMSVRMPASAAAETEGPHITKMRAILADAFSEAGLTAEVNSLTAGQVLQLVLVDFLGKKGAFAEPALQRAKENLTAVYESFQTGVQARLNGTKAGFIGEGIATAFMDSVAQHSAARDLLVTGGRPGGPTRRFTTLVPPTRTTVPTN
ncbi:Uncharacterised protein [Candidatus Burarchaeum australiense]|nr:Uncharacterised protein [Candidatus Burarchaeum australiense]